MALFQTVKELQAFLPVSNSFAPEGILDSVEIALQQKIAPIISAAQVQASVYDYQNIQDPVFLKNLKRAAAHFAFVQALPFLAVQVNNTGVQKFKNATTLPAAPEDLERLRLSSLDTAWTCVDLLLQIMENNPSEPRYTFYRTSVNYTRSEQSFIKLPEDFSRYEFIGANYRVFARLRPSIKFIEETEIYPVLTDSFATYLLANRSTPANQILLNRYVKPALCKLALADALPGLANTFGYDSVLTFANTTANYAKGYKTSEHERIVAWQNQLADAGMKTLSEVRPFIEINDHLYPDGPQPKPTPKLDPYKYEKTNTFF